jgi:hypothetical protein
MKKYYYEIFIYASFVVKLCLQKMTTSVHKTYVNSKEQNVGETRGLYYKTFYGRNLQIL